MQHSESQHNLGHDTLEKSNYFLFDILCFFFSLSSWVLNGCSAVQVDKALL